ncbi:hypothetical protein [Methanomassiliicoccus luminyensis]|uniref:hypothetical protein n=1 Tax=Methanomassiliicoccus luminyensis TaxID=1080712 RepID=UPI00037A7353|nr:hypothetical protein [Methanomassiliicoccus luminyensis]
MKMGNGEIPEEAIGPNDGKGPVPEVRSTVIETYIVTEEGPLKLAGFYVRVDRNTGEKSPLRRLIESE